MTGSLVPAKQLSGLQLANGWEVERLHVRPPSASGGNFSFGYFVRNARDGREGYLKALDFSRALQAPDPPRQLQLLTTAFNYERDLLSMARDRGMSRVAASIEDGVVNVDATSVIGRVPYLIFDRADGDVRSMQAMKAFDIAWVLRTLHHMAVGTSQLNNAGIAHQDIKPSNFLVFEGDKTKIADLGRAVVKGAGGLYDRLPIAGDMAYASPELLYSYTPSAWDKHRIGCDLYQLGSMFVFLFTGVTMNALLVSHLDRRHHPMVWSGTYRDVLPYVQDAFGNAIADFRSSVPAEVCHEIADMVAELCNPEPEQRGHPRDRTGFRERYSLERFVSRLDYLARIAERGLAPGSR